jgi:hypothetical protein
MEAEEVMGETEIIAGEDGNEQRILKYIMV